jgi:hypothetical protein
MEKKQYVSIEDKWLYFPVILLMAFFIFKLIDQSQIIHQFPLDQNNDISAHLGQLHFLKEYGFHQEVPNWYNGYTLFLNYPIAWYFLTLPLYTLLENILLATFLSHILLYIIGFIFFLILGRVAKLSLIRSIFFYLIFYANPVAIGNFIKLGRLTELTGLTFFVAFFVVLLYFKEKPFNIIALLIFILIYSSIILAHPSWIILSSLIIPSFFLLKNKKERFLIMMAFFMSLLITSFWLFPFLLTAQASSLETFYGSVRLITFTKDFFFDNLISFVVPIFMWFTAFFYFKILKSNVSKKEFKNELFFYIIPLIVSFLYITRIILFIPIINRPYPDSYHMLFIFLSIFLFLRTPLSSYPLTLKKVIKLSLLSLPFIFIISSSIFISNFRANNNIDKEIISLLPQLGLDDKFLIEKVPYPTSQLAFYSYAAIYHNLSTSSGWIIQGIDATYSEILIRIRKDMQEKNCKNLLKNLRTINTTKMITSNEYCKKMQDCGMKLLRKTENICLLDIPGL